MSMKRPNPLRNEDGFVLIAAIMVLLILVVIGISATTTSIFEVRIAGNNKTSKTTFYEADGGTDVATELLEQNLACPSGFSAAHATIGNISINNLVFWQNSENVSNSLNLTAMPHFPSQAPGPDFSWPTSSDNGQTQVTLSGHYVHAYGGALQQEAGYEGKGKSAAQGSAALDYNIFTQHTGANNSQSLLFIQYRHVVGSEGDCLY